MSYIYIYIYTSYGILYIYMLSCSVTSELLPPTDCRRIVLLCPWTARKLGVIAFPPGHLS